LFVCVLGLLLLTGCSAGSAVSILKEVNEIEHPPPATAVESENAGTPATPEEPQGEEGEDKLITTPTTAPTMTPGPIDDAVGKIAAVAGVNR